MSRATLIYALDPLCGWCFAFADTAAALRRALGDQVDWRIACGGLVTGDRVRPIADMAGYLRSGMRTVETRTSARFGAAFGAVLDEGRWVSDSEPGCRATLVVQEGWGGGAAVDFAGALARGFYGAGRLPDDPASVAWAAEQVGLEAEPVLSRWDTEAARRLTQEAFRSARAEGMTSYPTLYRRLPGEQATVVLPGWAPPTQALAAVRGALPAPS